MREREKELVHVTVHRPQHSDPAPAQRSQSSKLKSLIRAEKRSQPARFGSQFSSGVKFKVWSDRREGRREGRSGSLLLVRWVRCQFSRETVFDQMKLLKWNGGEEDSDSLSRFRGRVWRVRSGWKWILTRAVFRAFRVDSHRKRQISSSLSAVVSLDQSLPSVGLGIVKGYW